MKFLIGAAIGILGLIALWYAFALLLMLWVYVLMFFDWVKRKLTGG